MRFKIDETLSIEVADVLQRAGHDAMTIADQQASAQVDSKQLVALIAFWGT